MNCLTGQGEESRLSNTEMEQLIRNVRTVRQGTGCCTVLATQLSTRLSLPSRSWRSPTSTRMVPSTSPSSSTLSPAPRTLPGMVVSSGAACPGGPVWGVHLPRSLCWHWGRALGGSKARLPCTRSPVTAEGTGFPASSAESLSCTGQCCIPVALGARKPLACDPVRRCGTCHVFCSSFKIVL